MNPSNDEIRRELRKRGLEGLVNDIHAVGRPGLCASARRQVTLAAAAKDDPRARLPLVTRLAPSPVAKGSELMWTLMQRGPLIGLVMLAQASPAFSHAFLEMASPPVGGQVAASPPELSITFTEGVEPLFSTIEVRDPNGAAMATGKPHIAPDNDRRLVLELPKLMPGTYTVIWHVTSVDTHKTAGRYAFTLTR